MISLEKFRTQQKAIEEANKQKKALLTKTLSERYFSEIIVLLNLSHYLCLFFYSSPGLSLGRDIALLPQLHWSWHPHLMSATPF